MCERRLDGRGLSAYRAYLIQEERAPSTVEKYLRDGRAFAAWLGDAAVSREAVSAWKAHLLAMGQSPVSVNAKLSALNGLFRFLGWEECRARLLRLQRRAFREESKELTREEYQRLLSAARGGGPGAAGPAAGDHLRHRHPGFGAALRHGGGGAAETGGRGPQGENPHHPAAGEAVQEAAEIRREEQNRLRRGVPHQGRRKPVQEADLAGDEGTVPAGGGGAVQGVPPQPAPPVCLRLLPGDPGYRQAGRCAGARVHHTTRIYLLTAGTEHARQLERLGLVC